jgi:hypothetical protein
LGFPELHERETWDLRDFGNIVGGDGSFSDNLPNVKAQRRAWLARLVLLGARGVTDMIVRCSAWLGCIFFSGCRWVREAMDESGGPLPRR